MGVGNDCDKIFYGTWLLAFQYKIDDFQETFYVYLEKAMNCLCSADIPHRHQRQSTDNVITMDDDDDGNSNITTSNSPTQPTTDKIPRKQMKNNNKLSEKLSILPLSSLFRSSVPTYRIQCS